MRATERLLQEGSKGGGWLGVETQSLTPAIVSATGAQGGVVVTWVDPKSPAAGKLLKTDVIEAIGGQTLATLEEWEVHLARLAPGDSFRLACAARVKFRRSNSSPTTYRRCHRALIRLVLTMRAVPRTGIEVVRVEPGSAAARAGVAAGDVVTLIGEVERPTAAQITRAFLTTPEGGALLVGILRDHRHHVLALEKR